MPSDDFLPLREGEGEDEILDGDGLEAGGLINLSRLSEPTESRLRAKRSKLNPSERVVVNWKLGDKLKLNGLPEHKFASGLRESKSDGSLAATQRQKRCEAWFSGHDMYF